MADHSFAIYLTQILNSINMIAELRPHTVLHLPSPHGRGIRHITVNKKSRSDA
ncbi:MAG TPA: hypothetical protein VMG82_36685 [Candidatus Sulfotelmatobacter sp.]|nr:hypothetical protein [Candidatus Sulfotelmatobacter sp.]